MSKNDCSARECRKLVLPVDRVQLSNFCCVETYEKEPVVLQQFVIVGLYDLNKSLEVEAKPIHVGGMGGVSFISFLMGKVERPYKIEYQFINEKFKLIKQTLSGFEARVVQHEMDHLEGITLDSPDKMLLESKRESFKCDDINFEGLQEQLADLELASMKMKLDQFKGNK